MDVAIEKWTPRTLLAKARGNHLSSLIFPSFKLQPFSARPLDVVWCSSLSLLADWLNFAYDAVRRVPHFPRRAYSLAVKLARIIFIIIVMIIIVNKTKKKKKERKEQKRQWDSLAGITRPLDLMLLRFCFVLRYPLLFSWRKKIKFRFSIMNPRLILFYFPPIAVCSERRQLAPNSLFLFLSIILSSFLVQLGGGNRAERGRK